MTHEIISNFQVLALSAVLLKSNSSEVSKPFIEIVFLKAFHSKIILFVLLVIRYILNFWTRKGHAKSKIQHFFFPWYKDWIFFLIWQFEYFLSNLLFIHPLRINISTKVRLKFLFYRMTYLYLLIICWVLCGEMLL